MAPPVYLFSGSSYTLLALLAGGFPLLLWGIYNRKGRPWSLTADFALTRRFVTYECEMHRVSYLTILVQCNSKSTKNPRMAEQVIEAMQHILRHHKVD